MDVVCLLDVPLLNNYLGTYRDAVYTCDVLLAGYPGTPGNIVYPYSLPLLTRRLAACESWCWRWHLRDVALYSWMEAALVGGDGQCGRAHGSGIVLAEEMQK